MEYEFTLQFKLAQEDSDYDEIVERLAEADCTDAMVGLGVAGQLSLEFIREAESPDEAIFSALKAVKIAIPSAQLVEVGPDFVGLTDVAKILGMTRQNMSKLMRTHASKFPAPIHTGNPSLWHLEPVLQFFKERDQPKVTKNMIAVARTAMKLNLTKQSKSCSGEKIHEEMHALLV